MSKVKIENNDDIVRDMSTSAVLNVDIQSLKDYKARRARQKEIDRSLDRVDKLESDISEIKSLLVKLLDREENK
jgi:hypothetical protein